MKYLLLFVFPAFCSSVALAQNSATIAQTGTTNSASAIQTGSSLTATISQVSALTNIFSNTGVTNQTGTAHTATVNQDGGSSFNRAYITQKNGSSITGANSATLSQSNGSGGSVARGGSTSINTTPGAGNWSGVFQVGSSNQATVNQNDIGTQGNIGESIQQGSNNTAITDQNNGAKNGVALIFQGFDPNVPVVQVDVTDNYARINQNLSSANEAAIRQFSNGNTAVVNQDGTTSGNLSDVRQGSGTALGGETGNRAFLTQTSNAVSNTATVVQTGINGIALVEQSLSSQNNQVTIRQIEGTNGYAEVSQFFNSTGNKVTIVQYGNAGLQVQVFHQRNSFNNVATVNQGDAGNNSFNNKVLIGQAFGATSNTATISQNRGSVTGSNNSIQIEQVFDATNNLATVVQDGSNNLAGLRQTNPASTTGNVASFTQTGNNNLITGAVPVIGSIIPTGVMASALQNGSGNSMVVKQVSPDTGTLGNMATLNQNGDFNMMTVNQTIIAGGAVNMATSNQTGNLNTVTITQVNGITP